MKKLVLLLIIFVLIVFTSCEDVVTHQHTFETTWSHNDDYHWHAATCEHTDEVSGKSPHIWGEGTVTTAPTHTTDGVMTYVCTVCNATREVIIPASAEAHTFSAEWTYDETYHWHAATCGHDVIDAKAEHSWYKGVVTKDPTCTETGEMTYTCSVCGKIRTEIIPALAHDMKAHEKVAPTCTDAGTEAYWECSTCHLLFSDAKAEHVIEKPVAIPALEHDYSKEWTIDKEATCTEDGSKSHHCSRCESKSDVTVITALGHNYSDVWTIDVVANCTETGSKSHHCSKCDAKTDVTEIPALGHRWNAGEVTEDPTCTEPGVRAFTCLFCQATKDEPEPPIGHNYSDAWTIDVPATCTEAGSKSRHCSRCDAMTDVTVIPELGHSLPLVSYPAVVPTCTKTGNKEYWKCSVCSKLYLDAEGTKQTTLKEITLAATGHKWNEEWTNDGTDHWHVCLNGCGAKSDTAAHTFTDWAYDSTDEKDHRECSVCDLEEERAHVHVLSAHAEEVATCTKDGNKAYWECMKCGRYYTDDAGTDETTIEATVNPATGHEWDKKWSYDDDLHWHDCLHGCGSHDGEGGHEFGDEKYNPETGKMEKECKTCHLVVSEGHVHSSDTRVTTDPTGHYKVCDECGTEFDRADHEYGEWTYDKESGKDQHACTVCGRVESRTHDHGTEEAGTKTHTEAKDATCTEDGNDEYWHCLICDGYFEDEDCTIATTLEEIVKNKRGHNANPVEAVTAVCNNEGNIKYWQCTREECKKYFSDEACEHEITKEETVTHDPDNHDQPLEHKVAVDATCMNPGNIEYWHCDRCGKYFSDKACEHEITEEETVLAKLEHKTTHVEEVEALCNKDGNKEYWHCDRCDGYFLDEACTKGTTKEETVTHDPDNHLMPLEHKEAVDATCMNPGNIEYWYCAREGCQKCFSDNAGTKEIEYNDTIDPQKEHVFTDSPWHSNGKGHWHECKNNCGTKTDIVLHTFTDWTYNSIDEKDHRKCSVCDFDESRTHVHGTEEEGTLIHAEAKDATCEDPGNTEYWHCLLCGGYFKDKECTDSTTHEDTVIPVTDHDFTDSPWQKEDGKGHWHECIYGCGERTDYGDHVYEEWTYDSKSGNDVSTCAVCGRVESRIHAHGTEQTGTMIHAKANDATCENPGNIEYWQCTRCLKYFSNEACTKEIEYNDTIKPTVDHDFTNSPWHSNGKEHWHECKYNCGTKTDTMPHTFTDWTYDSNDGKDHRNCSECDFDESRTHVHGTEEEGTLSHTEAKDATCEDPGNIEYWLCTRCLKYFSDEACTEEIEYNDTIKPTVDHDFTDSPWQSNGEGHWKECKYDCKTETDIVPHTFTDWTYNSTDVKDHRKCSECGFDESRPHVHGKEEEDTLIYTAAKPACTEVGNIEYWHCLLCDGYFTDKECKDSTTREDTEIKVTGHHTDAGHHFEGKAATCLEDGYIEYWTCKDCGTYFKDNDLKDETSPSGVVIKATGHKFSEVWSSDAAHHWHEAICEHKDQISGEGEHSFNTNGVCDECDYDINFNVNEEGVLSVTDKSRVSGAVTIPAEMGGITVVAIADSAFSDCENLTGITIPDSVTSIGKNAFNGCIGLNEITIRKTVTSIGANAFKGCTGTIKFEDGMTSIPAKALIGASSVTTMYIPASVTSIGENAFEGCTGTIKFEDGMTTIPAEALSGASSITSVIIPTTVTSIGEDAFSDCTSLTSITLPFVGDGGAKTHLGYLFGAVNPSGNASYVPSTLGEVKIITDKEIVIGANAFSGCSGLTSITIPETVTSIEENAFRDCTRLESITIPVSVTSIGENAFSGCTSLSDIEIPDSVTSIGIGAFSDCSELKKITLPFIGDGGSKKHLGFIFGASDYSGNASKVPSKLDEVVIKTTKEIEIGERAFQGCSKLKSITITDKVKSIKRSAFSGCTNLDNITIPADVTSIESYVFSGCEKLANITIPDSVTSIGNNAFSGCTSLEEITIPDSVTSIGSNAFSGSGLTSIYIPNSVTSIGESAFQGCTKLTEIKNISDRVTSIGRSTFQGCTLLASIDIPDGVTSIGKAAFRECTSLTSITIPASVTSIGETAFIKCTDLNTVKISSLKSWCDISFATADSNPMYYASNLKVGDKLVEDLVIPRGETEEEKISSISAYAFYGCTGFKSIDIPDSVTRIGESAFYGCTSLTSISIPNSVTRIGNNAFGGCKKLESISLPFVGDGDSITHLGFIFGASDYSGHAEKVPSSLKKVEITTATIIGDNAFRDCTDITEVKMDEVTSIGKYAFSGCTKLGIKLVPKPEAEPGAEPEAEPETEPETEPGSFIIPDSVESIGEYAFRNCVGIGEITIGKSVTSIGEYAFSGCSGSVIFADGMKAIPENALLGGTSAITSVEIPNSVTSIGDNAFNGCTGLETIDIPDSVTSIGVSAFFGCNGLTSVTIPASIGDNAFRGCSRLDTVKIRNIEEEKGIGKRAFLDCPELANITFIGTKDDWIAIDKGQSWYNKDKAKATVVHCSDGDVDIV